MNYYVLQQGGDGSVFYKFRHSSSFPLRRLEIGAFGCYCFFVSYFCCLRKRLEGYRPKKTSFLSCQDVVRMYFWPILMARTSHEMATNLRFSRREEKWFSSKCRYETFVIVE